GSPYKVSLTNQIRRNDLERCGGGLTMKGLYIIIIVLVQFLSIGSFAQNAPVLTPPEALVRAAALLNEARNQIGPLQDKMTELTAKVTKLEKQIALLEKTNAQLLSDLVVRDSDPDQNMEQKKTYYGYITSPSRRFGMEPLSIEKTATWTPDTFYCDVGYYVIG